MNSSGFVPEILVAGLLTLLAGMILMVEFSVVSFSELQDLDVALSLPALLATSYLVGLSGKHMSYDQPGLSWLVTANREIYRERLMRRWPNFAMELINEWSEPDDHIEINDIEEITAREARLVINRLRLYQLSNYESAYAEHLNYQWNLARISKNCIVPLGLVFIACVIAVMVNTLESSAKEATAYGLLAGLSFFLVLGMRKVHHERSAYHLDTLIEASQANKS